MAKVLNRIAIEFTTNILINEDEARALEALVGYGVDNFLKTFYEKLGKAYLQPHEQGIRSFFKAVGTQVLPAIYQTDLVKDLVRREILEKSAAEQRGTSVERS